jgi:hypothetical protein
MELGFIARGAAFYVELPNPNPDNPPVRSAQ